MSSNTHVNAINGRPFSTVEAASLSQAMKARRFSEPRWATFQQWKGTGRTVAAAEKSRAIICTSATGFSWRVYNVAQLDGSTAVKAAAARAPVARASQPAPVKAAPKAAPELRRSPARRSARADNVKVTTRKPVKVAPVVAVAAKGKPVPPAVITPERIASLIRCNKRLAITETEARQLINALPGRTFSDPSEVAASYAAADTSRQAEFRRSEAKRWEKIMREQERRTPDKLGKAGVRAWLIFTGRPDDAKLYGNRKPGSTPADKPARKPVKAAPVKPVQPQPQPEPPKPTTPAPAAVAREPETVTVDSIPPKSWRERFAARFGMARAA